MTHRIEGGVVEKAAMRHAQEYLDGLLYSEPLFLKNKDAVGVNIWNPVKSKNWNFFYQAFLQLFVIP